MSIPGVDDDNDRQQDRQCGGGGAWRALIDRRGGVCDDGGKRLKLKESRGHKSYT
jgi:hypothetical protein